MASQDREVTCTTGGRCVVCLLGGSALSRAAYATLLQEALHLPVAAESDFRPVSVWTALRTQPDVAIVEADAARPEVLDAVEMMVRLRPSVRILAVSAAVEPEHVELWARCPLAGYVVKDGGLDEFRAAVRAVVTGGEYFSPGIAQLLARAAHATARVHTLSPREAELLPLLARGLTLRDAALAMSITYKTADSHRSNLLRKLNLRDRVELARYAIRQGLIEA